jgi:hypothetical protein
MSINRRLLGVIAAVLTVIVLLTACTAKPEAKQPDPETPPAENPVSAPPTETPEIDPANLAPAFSGADLVTGKAVNFPGDAKGHAALLNFFQPT